MKGVVFRVVVKNDVQLHNTMKIPADCWKHDRTDPAMLERVWEHYGEVYTQVRRLIRTRVQEVESSGRDGGKMECFPEAGVRLSNGAPATADVG